jgi:two-component system phosphate regulon sensor histidine kinase PhoR
MIVVVVVLTIGWVLVNVWGLFGKNNPSLYWTFLAIGSAFFVFILVGVVMYLTLSIKAINLNRRQSNFIDSVTHELKSPIASLKLYLQTIKRRELSPQERQAFYRSMLEDVERLDELINHLLDAARMERGAAPDEFETIELSQLLRDCSESVCMRYRVPQETVKLKLQPCTVKARRVDVDMIFRNLIDNAVKYADNEPAVEIELGSEAAGRVVVRVADNGHGIPLQLRRKIFGRFVRLGSELEREKPGTGLGLYIVRNLVYRMKGKIQVQDRSEGQGTVFEVILPGELARQPTNPETDTGSKQSSDEGESPDQKVDPQQQVARQELVDEQSN